MESHSASVSNSKAHDLQTPFFSRAFVKVRQRKRTRRPCF